MVQIKGAVMPEYINQLLAESKPKEYIIEQLIEHEFPLYTEAQNMVRAKSAQTASMHRHSPKHDEYIIKVQAQQVAWRKMSLPELEALLKAARETVKDKMQKDLEASNLVARLEDEKNFDAPADYEYWGKLSVWTLEQGVALLLGKNPNVIKWERLKLYAHKSLLAAQFKQYMDVGLSDLKLPNLTHMTQYNNLPPFFIKWADKHDFPVPEKLRAVVTKYGDKWTDWRDLQKQTHELLEKSEAQNKELNGLYDTLKNQRDERTTLLASTQAQNAELLRKLVDFKKANDEIADATNEVIAQRDAFKKELEALKLKTPESSSSKPTDKAVDPRERTSLQKMILVLLFAKHKKNMLANKPHPIGNAVSSSANELGVSIDSKTVVAHLEKAMLTDAWADITKAQSEA